jgi:hypothetical protein
MSLNNKTTDLSGKDFQLDSASNANEMATTIQASNSENLDSKGMLYDILDLDERIKSEDTEESDPDFPEQNYYEEEEIPEEWKEGYVDEVFLIENQLQEEENARIKGYPMPMYN